MIVSQKTFKFAVNLKLKVMTKEEFFKDLRIVWCYNYEQQLIVEKKLIEAGYVWHDADRPSDDWTSIAIYSDEKSFAMMQYSKKAGSVDFVDFCLFEKIFSPQPEKHNLQNGQIIILEDGSKAKVSLEPVYEKVTKLELGCVYELKDTGDDYPYYSTCKPSEQTQWKYLGTFQEDNIGERVAYFTGIEVNRKVQYLVHGISHLDFVVRKIK